MSAHERPGDDEIGATDIAIVGMACRFPGANDIETYWRNVRDGVESIVDLSRAELDAAGVDPAQLRHPNYVRRSAILDDMEGFDAGFFGFSPKDAAIMDPQHRHFLEVAWEALESAGHPPETFTGAIGVYAGCGMGAYMMYNLIPNRHLMSTVGLFLVRHTGNDKDFLATRVSYSFDLKGPSVNVQTACSTSLVAIHMASQSLLSNECDMALAGGVTIELPHRVGYVYQEGEILSHDGRCRAFDAASTGTVFGSGAGVVVLRRLQDAIDDGDTIFAVIKGSAINNDGSSKVGYLAPSVDGQAQAIAEAQALAGVTPDTITYVETHGTGTQVGDPIEVTALTQAFRRGTARNQFCGIGSVKTNIGHTDTAAGIASFIKVVQALSHRQLPPSLHFTSPNPLIDFASSPFYVNATLRSWDVDGFPRRAGVSSLGVGGTNAHVVVQEAPRRRALPDVDGWHLLVLSARTPTALDAASDRLADHLSAGRSDRLADVAFTLQTGRHAFAHRRVLVCKTADDARQALEERDPKRVFTHTAADQAPGVVFLFPGGGAQYPNMGLGLYQAFEPYRQAVDECLALMRRHLDADLRALMFPAPGAEADAQREIERPSRALPTLFTTSYALARLWMSWGVTPSAMSGHSMGEYVAACLAGVMTLDDALMLVTTRGRLFERLPLGGMLSVPLPPDELAASLTPDLSIAAVNGPALCVASGPDASLADLAKRLAARDVESQRLRISVAAHSSMLDGILDEFGRTVAKLRLNAPTLPFVSNVTGTWASAGDVATPGYWVTHLRQTVRFGDGLQEILKDPHRVLIEVGPGTTLTSLAKVHPAKTASHTTVSSLRHPQEAVSDLQFFLTTFGRLWAAGYPVDWTVLHADGPRRRVQVPSYPFEHQRYWIDPVKSTDDSSSVSGGTVARLPQVDQWFYRATWKRGDRRVTAPPPPADTGTWLVFQDEFGLGEGIVSALRAQNHSVVTVQQGRSYQQRNVDFYVVHPGQREDYDAMFAALAADGKRPRRILHLWSLSAARAQLISLDDLDAALDRSFYSLLFLAQAIAAQDLSEPTRLVVVSNGMQQVIDEPVAHPEQATVLGPTRVISREFPSVSCQSVDIELPRRGLHLLSKSAPTRDETFLVSALLDELSAPSSDPVVAYRNRHRWTECHERVRVAAPATADVPLRDRGVYVITGGLGAIGLAHAAYLARTVKARLVLLTRSSLPPSDTWASYLKSHDVSDLVARRIRHVQQLEETGAEVMVLEADVADVIQTRKALAQAQSRFGAIHGVIHAAGTIADTVIPLKTKDSAASVLGPKVRGTLALDVALASTPLDFLVVFSSTSAILGPPGQVDYVAANAFLNAFAFSRAHRAAGITRAIGWGLWKDIGMAVEAARLLGHAPATEAPVPVAHPLLQHRQATPVGDVLFTAVYSVAAQWVLDEHRFGNGVALIPGTGYLEVFRAVADAVFGRPDATVGDVSFVSPLAIGDHELRHVRIAAVKRGESYDVTVSSYVPADAGDAWHDHATATIAATAAPPAAPLDLHAIRGRCPRVVVPPGGAEPQTRQESHLRFGPRWRNLKHVWFGAGEALAELSLAPAFEVDLEDFKLHPALLDLATGFALPLLSGYDTAGDFYIPLSYRAVRIFAPLPSRIFSYVRCANPDEREVAMFDYVIVDEHGQVVAEIDEFVMRRIADTRALALTVPPGVGATPPDTRNKPGVGGMLPEILELGMEHGITAEEGVAAFTRVLANTDSPQVVVTSLDLDQLMRLVDRAAARSDDAAAPKQSRPASASGYVAPRSDLERKIAVVWQEILGIDQVGLKDNFFDLGGHSLLAVRLFNRLKKLSGQNLPLSTLFEAPTVEQLASLLQQDKPQVSWSCLVPIQPNGTRPPFFCIHGLGGNIVEFLHLARYLRPDQPFYGIQARGLDGKDPYFTRVEDFASHYIKEIKALQPAGPYFLAGSSFGGLVAYEMARQLEAQGERVALLGLFDSYGKNYPKPVQRLTMWRRKVNNLRVRVDLHWGNLKNMQARERWEYAREKLGQLPGRYHRRIMKRIDRIEEGVRLLLLPKMLREQLKLTGESAKSVGRIDIPRAIRDVQVGVTQAARSYRLQPFAGEVTLFRATSQPPGIYPDRTNGWGELVTGKLVVHDVPGYHGAIIREPRVKALAEILNQCLEDAQDQGRKPGAPLSAPVEAPSERADAVEVDSVHAGIR
ncbi:MAG: SDR family NAD(P)-dependent oxidoreductase [Vicinamibacterales bacterium]